MACETLEGLVVEHDVIFLLTDTRESRWLPTLLAARHNKLAITAALGFDSYVVMRHGQGEDCATSSLSSSTPRAAAASSASSSAAASAASAAAASSSSSPALHRLGCYFCNDVVAPSDSTRDRAMDQQCTVARPGLSFIAGATAVELMAACLAKEARGGDPNRTERGGGSPPPLGDPPHMMRGNLTTMTHVVMTGHAFGACTACSPAMVERYKEEGWDLVRAAMDRAAVLEDVSGLAALMKGLDTIDVQPDGDEDATRIDAEDEEGEDDWLEL